MVRMKEAKLESLSDTHFTVLAFNLGSWGVVMCAIIMKSEKDVTDLPMSWTLGIDISKEMHTGKTTLETYDLNYKSVALIGGQKCTKLFLVLYAQHQMHQ
jgi:hypothetical protein